MKLYWRIKKNGKWTWQAAKVLGYTSKGALVKIHDLKALGMDVNETEMP